MKKVCIIKSGWMCSRRVMDYLDFLKYAKHNRFIALPRDRIEESEFAILISCGSCDYSLRLSLKELEYIKKYIPNKKVLVLGCISEIIPEFEEKYKCIGVSPKKYDSEVDNAFIRVGIVDEICRPYNSLNHSTLGFQEYIPYFTKDHWFLYTSTGCLGNCKYCRIKNSVGNLRSESLKSIIDSFLLGIKKGYSKFWPTGDDLGAYGLDIGMNYPQLLKRLIEEGRKHTKNFAFDCRTIINCSWLFKYKDELLDLIEKYPDHIISLGIGLQSYIPRLLELSKRYSDIDSIKEILVKFKKVNPNLFMLAHLIVGLPTETINETEVNIENIKKLPIDLYVCSKYSHLKGSKFYEEYKVRESETQKNYDHFLKLIGESSLYYQMVGRDDLIHVLKKPNPNFFVHELSQGEIKR